MAGISTRAMELYSKSGRCGRIPLEAVIRFSARDDAFRGGEFSEFVAILMVFDQQIQSIAGVLMG